jgi:hypothetical protein
LDSLFRTAIGVTPFLTLIRRNCFYIIITDVLGMSENLSKKFFDFMKDVRKDKFKPIVFGLFALIGFIILVYSIFVRIAGEPLVSVADTVFVAVLIGSFTLVGIIIGRKLLTE